MKSRLSLKIFVILMFAFIIILTVSLHINLQSQLHLYNETLRLRHQDTDYINKLYETLDLSHYNENNPFLVKEKIMSEDFELPSTLNSNSFHFIIQQDSSKQKNNIILKDDNFEDYIIIESEEGEQITFLTDVLTDRQKKSLIDYAIKGFQDKSLSQPGNVKVEYEAIDHQVTYLKWGDQVYGTVQKNTQQGSLGTFRMLKKKCVQSKISYDMFLVDCEEVASLVQDINMYTGYRMEFFKEVNGKYYYIYETNLTSMNDSQNTDMYAITVAVEDNVEEYVTELYLENNMNLYIGTFIFVAIISWLISYAIGKPIKKIEKVAYDITNQNFDEPIQIKSKDEIGNLAKSIDIMRIQLKQTIDQLNEEIQHVKELESLRKDFINQFTHEMKTPLGIINGYSELLDEAENEEEKERYLDIINKETSRINQLIQSMLNLSRLEAGKVEVKKESFDLEDLVTEIIDEYEVLLMKKNIQVKVNVIESMLYADRNLIQTVVHNFLSNAIKHTYEEGKIIVTINHGLSVFNEGDFIEESRLESIWYTFVTHDQEGSGLGLAICRSILELHGFEYGVMNKEGGVEFYFHQEERK